jgi:hypothetical protein
VRLIADLYGPLAASLNRNILLPRRQLSLTEAQLIGGRMGFIFMAPWFKQAQWSQLGTHTKGKTRRRASTPDSGRAWYDTEGDKPAPRQQLEQAVKGKCRCPHMGMPVYSWLTESGESTEPTQAKSRVCHSTWSYHADLLSPRGSSRTPGPIVRTQPPRAPGCPQQSIGSRRQKREDSDEPTTCHHKCCPPVQSQESHKCSSTGGTPCTPVLCHYRSVFCFPPKFFLFLFWGGGPTLRGE